MAFAYTRQGLPPQEQRLERLLECVPGAMSWSLLAGMIALSFWQPPIAAAVMIAFYLFWLFRLAYLTLFLILSYARLAAERHTDWMACLQALDRAATTAPAGGASGWLARWTRLLRARELRAVQRQAMPPPASRAILHVVLLPIATEGREIYEPGVVSLTRQEFPAQQILVVLAVEGRAPATVREAAAAVQARYRDHFLDMLVVEHPDHRPGEARVKGANVTYAAQAAAAALAQRGHTLEHAMISCFDADTTVAPSYFSCLTYHFLICPDRTRASFQPIPVYHNNIWDVPGFARVLDVGASFFQLIEATNPEQLVTFSSHSMSFQALHEIGYWPVDLVSEDSAVFWKALIHFAGRYRVVPVYVTVSMDVAASTTWWRTARNVYHQKRRWAWGVENFPIVLRGFLRARGMRWREKARFIFKMLEGHVSWATWPFLLTGIGWLPGIVAGREFLTSVMYYTAPRIATTVFHLATLALVVTVALSMLLVPRPPARYPLWYRARHAAEWLLLPFIAVIFSALPALDAQTRLLMGRYMEFWVTEKHRIQ